MVPLSSKKKIQFNNTLQPRYVRMDFQLRDAAQCVPNAGASKLRLYKTSPLGFILYRNI